MQPVQVGDAQVRDYNALLHVYANTTQIPSAQPLQQDGGLGGSARGLTGCHLGELGQESKTRNANERLEKMEGTASSVCAFPSNQSKDLENIVFTLLHNHFQLSLF